MDRKNWETIKKCARLEKTERVPVGLIVDSPWIPGYVGISTIDYFTMPDKWFSAQIKIKKDFADLIFIPDLWVEFGMTAEPSGFGCKTMFYENNTPAVLHMIDNADDIDILTRLSLPNPKTDGFMPIILNLYKNMAPRFADVGESIKIVAARGPFTIASHLMGLTEFLIALKIYPEEIKKLLKLTAQMTKIWLQAQAEILNEVEGIIILDDVMGFLSRQDYLEFAHDIFKVIFDSFSGNIKIFHNDTDNPVCYEFISDLGIDIFNFTHKQELAKVKELCGDRVCLMGNIPPMEVLYAGSRDEIMQNAQKCLAVFPDNRGLILSAGGGTSPGTPKESILALLDSTLK